MTDLEIARATRDWLWKRALSTARTPGYEHVAMLHHHFKIVVERGGALSLDDRRTRDGLLSFAMSGFDAVHDAAMAKLRTEAT